MTAATTLSSQPTSTRADAVRGAIRVAPLLAGVAPFGFAVGAAGAAANLPPLAAWSSAVLVYGGSIQLVTLQLVESGAAPAIVAAAALLAAVPRCLFAVALAPGLGATSWRWRALAAYLLVEPVFAASAAEDSTTLVTSPTRRRAFYVGAGVTVFVVWLAVTALGAVIGGQLPTGLGFELTVPVMMLALAAGSERTPPAWMGAATAGALSLVLINLPHRSGFIVAVVAGVTVAALIDRGAE
jgi:predicted branched-subunit amino acid permease